MRVFGAGHPWKNGGNQACCNPGGRGQNHSSGGEAGESAFQSTPEQIFTEGLPYVRNCARMRSS